MSILEARKLIGNKIIGVTCHNSIKLTKIAIKNKADYIALGGFYYSKTKKLKYKASIDLLKKVNKANFLAISGYIWNNEKLKPTEAIKKLK